MAQRKGMNAKEGKREEKEKWVSALKHQNLFFLRILTKQVWCKNKSRHLFIFSRQAVNTDFLRRKHIVQFFWCQKCSFYNKDATTEVRSASQSKDERALKELWANFWRRTWVYEGMLRHYYIDACSQTYFTHEVMEYR